MTTRGREEVEDGKLSRCSHPPSHRDDEFFLSLLAIKITFWCEEHEVSLSALKRLGLLPHAISVSGFKVRAQVREVE
jgi:hypothetical protein